MSINGDLPVRRVLLVDDSGSARRMLAARLQEHGFEVEDVPDAITAAARALTEPPDIVVTDLLMPGMSGLQLCRLLKAEQVTAAIPVVLLTATSDRKSRFWARCAGASAYVAKSQADQLVAIVRNVSKACVTPTPGAGKAVQPSTVLERLSKLLDTALYESVVAGEIRGLPTGGGIEEFFTRLASFSADVVGYRWLGLKVGNSERFLLHSAPNQGAICETEARGALGVRGQQSAFAIEDDRVLSGKPSPPIVLPIPFGEKTMGSIALGAGPSGASYEDERFIKLIAGELGGPLQIVELMGQAQHTAATDPLTGLMNRRAFLEAVGREQSRSHRHSYPIALLLLDIDHFKKVNDTRGHAAGDAVLRGVAQVIAKVARKSDIVARWGGEEFLVALTQTSETAGRIAAERIRRAIAETPYAVPDGEPVIATASIGLSGARSEVWQFEDLVSRADKAMYAAKSRGRNRVEVA